MLFTCAAVRTIHLELVEDMTAKSCLDPIRRFVTRCGVPEKIISDNAKTFKRADIELRKLEKFMHSADVQDMAGKRNITWQLIPERAAWWGQILGETSKERKTLLKSGDW